MKAAVYHGQGSVRIESVPEPAEPCPGEVVLEVLRASICGTDAGEWQHGPSLCAPPVVLGHEFTGRVVVVGAGVESLGLGDRVVSGAGVSCGRCRWCAEGRTNLCASYRTLGLQIDGGLAELVTTPAEICRRVPDACDDDAAATAQPLAVALHAVDRGGIGAGERVAIIGAGGIGAFIVAAAVARGATVTALDIDPDRLATAARLGAREVIDVRDKDLAASLLELTDGTGFDAVIELSGAPHAPAAAADGARRGGRVVVVGLQSAPRELDLTSLAVREIDLTTTVAHVCDSDLPAALELLAGGTLAPAVIDRTIPLAALVEEGLRPLADGAAKGKILVDPTA